MATNFFIWPVGLEAEADAYLAAADAANPDQASDNWYPPGIVDAHGQRVVAKLGPPWVFDVGEFPEPESCAGLHANAVEASNWDRLPSPE